MFKACADRSNPDSHNYLLPTCGVENCDRKFWVNHSVDDAYPPHEYVPTTEPLVWGENAIRQNDCERFEEVEPDEYHTEGRIDCGCPCHWSIYYVNVYTSGRAYGGPEEGGWWYTYGIPYASVPFDTFAEAKTYQESVEDKYPNKPRNYDEEFYTVLVENHFAAYWPEVKPHYE